MEIDTRFSGSCSETRKEAVLPTGTDRERRKPLARFLHEYPGANSQQLRTLIRNARREQRAALPPRSYRELFRALREMTTKEPAADA